MKRIALLAAVALLVSAPVGRAADIDPDGAGWRLINDDRNGNLLYVAPATVEHSADGYVKVWMKFETRAENSPSPMLFLNEIDCSGGRIKRIAAKLYKPTCAGSGEPMQALSFDGKWDRPAVGIEERLRDAVCQGGGLKSL